MLDEELVLLLFLFEVFELDSVLLLEVPLLELPELLFLLVLEEAVEVFDVLLLFSDELDFPVSEVTAFT